MQESRFNELVAKEFAGENNAAEKSELQQLISNNPEYRKWHELYRDIWADTRINYQSNRTSQSFEKIAERINDGKQFYLKRNVREKSLLSQRTLYYKIAVVFLIFVASIFLVRFFIYRQPKEQDQQVVMLERVVPKGQKARIYLPDGSIVWLNAESKIRYPEHFDEFNRTVLLEGEGYFEVEKDVSKPFTVRTNRVIVTALGTSFNVRVYSMQDAQVSLNSGKVLVRMDSDSNDQVILSPGQGIQLRINKDRMERIDVDPDDAFMWKDGLLYFKDASFSEVIEKLSRWYGVSFEVENYNSDPWKYSANFKNEYLNNILKSMGYTKDFNYRIEHDKVFIKFKNKI